MSWLKNLFGKKQQADEQKVGHPMQVGAQKRKERQDIPDSSTNSIGIQMKMIPTGSFIMGAEKGCFIHEKPKHQVTITKPFLLGIYPVTQVQYSKIMGINPSFFKGSDRPVDQVSWNDAQEFCKRLSQKEGAKYRLPSEAEWEYAARAGTSTVYYWGDEIDGGVAWYDRNSERQTHAVGLKKPNAWGLFDMLGNVFEWCEDWHGAYPSDPQVDPQGPINGEVRVLRGGSWYDNGPFISITVTFRNGNDPLEGRSYYGFRIARTAEA
jgi:eukaryotic-like serine/threonine-protein kinase